MDFDVGVVEALASGARSTEARRRHAKLKQSWGDGCGRHEDVQHRVDDDNNLFDDLFDDPYDVLDPDSLEGNDDDDGRLKSAKFSKAEPSSSLPSSLPRT